VIGQERLKLALLLCALDPAIGGVLVRGPRGVAKTTLARAFSELLPGRFVELPLGATEERVAGSLDLGKALGSGEVQFSPGLLARAHEGVLYVDEVNLLPDAIVDLLLDAAASGTNVIERDGISHVHPARFVLIGTMNPEEGELRPQLVDRFGLSVSADAVSAPEERAQIALRRLAFERDPEAFAAQYESERHALAERCARARRLAPQLSFDGPGSKRVAELCHAALVDGVRADLAMLRAARAHAAWHARDVILEADVDAVAELALAHRRRAPRGSPPGSPPPGERSEPPAPAGSERRGTPGAQAGPAAEGTPASTSSSDGDRGALPAVPVRARDMGALPAWWFGAEPSQRERDAAVSPRRRQRGAQLVRPGAIDWFRTLLEAPRPPAAGVRRRLRRLRRERLWIVTLDCSASMLQSGAAGVAKGIARAITAQAAGCRARLALISFGGTEARRASAGAPAEVIGALAIGGGTPLRRALELALEIERGAASTRALLEPRWFLLTDGRSLERIDDLEPRSRSRALLVIDCELGPLRLGRARKLATTLGGTYTHAEALLSRAAPSASPAEQERELGAMARESPARARA
jgi:magnesium chelatase subunit D